MKLEDFILQRIVSIDHLRALLLLKGEPARIWQSSEIGALLHLETNRAGEVLSSLVTSGLAGRDPTSGGYQFVGQTGELATLIEALVQMDRERPVSLIRLIYSRSDPLGAFSDAFRLRRNQ